MLYISFHSPHLTRTCPIGLSIFNGRMLIIKEENVAIDLETFSRHAGRTTVTTDDVLLLARRNADLHAMIKDAIDKQKAEKAKKARGK